MYIPYSEYNDNLLHFWIEQARRCGDRQGQAIYTRALESHFRLTRAEPDRASSVDGDEEMLTRPAG